MPKLFTLPFSEGTRELIAARGDSLDRLLGFHEVDRNTEWKREYWKPERSAGRFAILGGSSRYCLTGKIYKKSPLILEVIIKK